MKSMRTMRTMRSCGLLAALLIGTPALAQKSPATAAPKSAEKPAAAQPAPAAPVGGCAGLGNASFFADEALSFKVASKLQFNKALLREKIGVKINGGVVTLSGNVSTAEHVALAGQLASEVKGVRCVNNLLAVGTPDYAPPRLSSD